MTSYAMVLPADENSANSRPICTKYGVVIDMGNARATGGPNQYFLEIHTRTGRISANFRQICTKFNMLIDMGNMRVTGRPK